MPEQFNKLNPGEAERLFLLLEEMAEVQQIIGKVLRHGYESHHPDGGPSNRKLLEKELGDVLLALKYLREANDISWGEVLGWQDRKEKSIKTYLYLHHQ